MNTKLLLRKLRQAFLPTAQMREYERWMRDGGDERFRFNYQNVGPRSRILDVGGYHGQWSSDMIARYGCKSLIFEPIPEFAAFIRERFKAANVAVTDAALGASHRQLMLNIDGVYSTEFTRRPQVSVRMIDVADLRHACGPDNFAAMSINCEGGEYELLHRLIECGLILRIEELEIQFHDFVPGAAAKRDALRLRLSKTHREVYSYPFVWEHWSRQ